MADGSTLTRYATPTTSVNRPWLDLMRGQVRRFEFLPTDETDPALAVKVGILVPATPKARAWGERMRAAVLAAVERFRDASVPVEQDTLLHVAVIVAVRALLQVEPAHLGALAARFGLEVRRCETISGRPSHGRSAGFFDPAGSFACPPVDAPVLELPFDATHDVRLLEWGIGAQVCHWLGVPPSDSRALAEFLGDQIANWSETPDAPVGDEGEHASEAA